MKQQTQAEQLISTQFSKGIWNPVRRAVTQYRLIEPDDRIAVCLSGGKDSLLMGVTLQMLQKYGPVPFHLTGLCMDPGYSACSRQQIEENLRQLGLSAQFYQTKLFQTVNRETDNPCFLCSRLRRGSLYSKAQELGCNKIALGHHYDDVIETTLMSMLYGGQIQTMLPRLRAKNYAGVQVIRPLYLVRERSILVWRDACSLRCLACSCSFAEKARREDRPESSKRYEVKRLIAQMEAQNEQVPKNIFNSLKNVNVQDLLGWHNGTEQHSFLDEF